MKKDNKYHLSIDSVKPGMTTAEVVFNKFGSVVLWDGILLDDAMITRLKTMGVQNISVFSDEPIEGISAAGSETSGSVSQQFTLDYERDAHGIKQVFYEISSGRSLNVEATEQVLSSVVEKSGENRSIINSIMQVRTIDEYTYYHSLNVSMLCMLIGKWLKLDDMNVRKLAQAGLLHDVGKTRIPLTILNKPGKLTHSELVEMRRHSEYGYSLVSDIREIPPEVAVAVLTHHEKEDGSGYPLGLTGEKLNLFSKIITVADIFDAMTANRSYKGKDTP
ncbi:MAG: HD-GYP domain-containing protein, partial [Clostridia bacterium]|nr:HD-GYP domain-containing protein [Clostridia bacterium]